MAGHQEANGHGGVGGCYVREGWRLCQVVRLVLAAQVVGDGEDAPLVVLRCEEGDEDVGEKEEREDGGPFNWPAPLLLRCRGWWKRSAGKGG